MKKPVRRKGYAEGGYVTASDGTRVYVTGDAGGSSQAFRNKPVDLTPPKQVADASKARGGKVKKVIRKR